MSIYYITGIPAAGKSAVQAELVKRGYLAYDSDKDNITSWRHKKTGELVFDYSKGDSETHLWATRRDKLLELEKEANGKPVFLCGTSSNRYEIFEVFDKVFNLVIDEATLRHRLATRTTNDYGKDPETLADILSWHKAGDEDDLPKDVIKIDTTKPVSEVVDEIISSLS